MRALLFSIGTIILLSCNNAAVPVQPHEAASQKGLIITFDTFERIGSQTYLTFIIENKTDSTYYTAAYNKSIDGTLSPLYTFEQKINGLWENLFIGWCGTGADVYSIQPGERLTFSTHTPESSSQYIKAGIYTSTDSSAPNTQRIFSNEVKIQ